MSAEKIERNDDMYSSPEATPPNSPPKVTKVIKARKPKAEYNRIDPEPDQGPELPRNARELKQLEIRLRAEELMAAHGRRLKMTKAGEADRRQPQIKARSAAQLASARRMIESNAERRRIKQEARAEEVALKTVEALASRARPQPQPTPAPQPQPARRRINYLG